MAVDDFVSVLTSRQMETLFAIASHTAREGMPPTLTELREALGLAPSTNTSSYLHPLFENGYLEKPTGRYARRALKLTPEAVPVLKYLAEQRGEYSEVATVIDTLT